MRNPSNLTAREAWGDFVSYLSIVRAFKNDPEALRHALNSDNWRLTGLIFRMAETAGLYDQITGWEGEDDDC